ncbi:autotransporter domain-containing protein [Sphingomonas gei]|nr:autotransporter domain-containing protein [Sphingomonas gei]
MNVQKTLAPPGARRQTSRLAALAASVSFAAIASPAFAQCVEGPPANFTCAGQTDVSQVITVDDAKVTATPAFEVDTSGNGNGLALDVSGDGLISYEGGEAFSGAGVRFATTGSSGLSGGELSIFSNADIFANGTRGLRLENSGGGDTVASWLGTISNIGGDGVFSSSDFGGGDLSLIVKDVSARDDGIRIAYGANGSVVVTAVDAVSGQTGAGVRIIAGDASDDVDLTVGEVTGGTFGIIVDSTGTDVVKVDAGGTVTGLSADGIRVSAGADTLGIDIRAAQVNGATSGITASSLGSGNLSIVATGLVTGATENGIFASSQGPVGDLSVTATDVIGDTGIRTYNSGVGATTVIATGTVSGFGNDGINVLGDVATTDMLVDVHDVVGATQGIRAENLGSGDTVVRASGLVTSASTGISILTTAASQSASIEAVDVTSDTTAITLTHEGIGLAQVNATGNLVGTLGSGISVAAGMGATDIRVTAVNVTGGNFGIYTRNEGTGETFIAVTGLVVASGSSPYGYGILAQNREGTTTDLLLRAAEVQSSRYGIVAESDGSGTMTVLADKVTGQTAAAVRVYAEEAVSAVNVSIGEATGGTTGIEVFNLASGFASIQATGTVTGLTEFGISVTAGDNSTGVDVRANQVNGATAGIAVVNNGGGDTSITATGTVASSAGYGIVATNDSSANAISITATDVIGQYGILASNFGSGATSATSTGDVVGYAFDGIRLGNAGTGTDLFVDVNNVEGQDRGINLLNDGTGFTAVRASGSVTGTVGSGIAIDTGVAAQDVTVGVVDVSGISGIVVGNHGLGSTRIAAAGTVTGVSGNAIEVLADTLAGEVEIDVAEVTGSTGGVIVTNFGTGSTNVTATGTVSALAADGFGISVVGGTGSTDIRIAAADVIGNARGVHAENDGSGGTVIASTGLVTGGNDFGIFARNGGGATDLTILANAVQGAEDGIATQHTGLGATSITAAKVTGQTGAGVRTDASGTAGDVVLALGEVSGGTYGVLLTNYGMGNTAVETTGSVTALVDAGLAIENGPTATGIDLRAAQVTGATYGIQVDNLGTGNTAIAATGPVAATAGWGVIAYNAATANDLSIATAAVTGQLGIFAFNEGLGSTAVVSTGTVTGTAATGIDVRAGTVAQDVRVEAVNVTGTSGITVQNFGQGAASIGAGGTVTSTAATGTGIGVASGTGSTDIRVAAVAVAGGERGIDTVNNGTGETLIAATGLVSGSQFGIRAENNAGATNLTIRAAAINSGGSGIVAENDGSGRTTVLAGGTVSALGEAGIGASAGATAGDVSVEAGAVSGGLVGIFVNNGGTGTTSIVGTGPVTGGDLGIRASAGATAGDIVIEAGNASGGSSGISAVNFGLGDTRITIGGIVQGGTRGIEAFSEGNQQVVIVNNGTIRNTSGLGSARAISASGGGVAIGNSGTLLGTVELAGDSSLLLNSGSWRSTGGTSNFATLDDTLLNTSTGTIVGGVLAATAETSVWQGLERFQQNGVLRLQDGGAGDMIQTSAATTFANGSLLSVDIAGLNAADSFHTTGKVTIEAGSRLQAVTNQPLMLHGKHVVVQADGGLTGQFVFEDQLITAFAGLRDGYTATSAFLEFAQMKALASAGLTPNQKAAAGGADSLPDGNAVKDALLLLPTDAAAQAAFDQLSGEIHPSARNAMVEDSRLIRTAILDRLGDGEPGSALWGRLFATSGVSDGDYNAAELDRDTKGGMIGLDRSFGSVTVGVAGGWSDTKLRIARRDSNGSIESIQGMVYAGGRFGGFGLRGGVGYARTSTETTRRIAFQGFSASPTADYDGSVLQGFVETGYRLSVGGGYFEPFAGLSAIRAKTDAFTEAGGPAALSGGAISERTMRSTLGARFETSAAGALSLRGTAGWSHGWGDLDPVGRHAFAGGTPFDILGTAGSKDAGVLDAEARYRLSPNVTLSIGYNGVLGAGNADHAITGAFKIVF